MVRRLRELYNGFISRHEVAWELSMAALAIVYVGVGFGGDSADERLSAQLRAVEGVVTVVFLLEFGTRFLASFDRPAYLRSHWIDLVALVPTVREVRILRLLRFLRLIRAAAGIYRAFGVPVLHRVVWHLQRVKTQVDPRTGVVLAGSLAGIVLVAAAAVTWLEGPITFNQLGESMYWAVTTLLGSGDAGFVSTLAGRIVSGALIVSSLTFLAVVTGLIIGFIVDVLLKEGQGMGVAGMTGHIVVCGWNATAREVIAELRADDPHRQVVLLADLERGPTGSTAHYVRGDPALTEDLERAGIRDAASAIIFPEQAGDDGDMRSILIVMAIEDMAPGVRTVVEVANPRNVPHLKRARADEVIATSQFVAHLLARSSVHAGLVDLVMSMVSGGEGSELYRVPVPSAIASMTAEQAGPALRREHSAVLIAVVRDGQNIVNPPGDFQFLEGDEIVVFAESVEELRSH
jgi:voltage-gated potassium channel